MYVVTGATGRTGRVVAEELLRRGRAVRALGRSADRLASLAASGAQPFVTRPDDAAGLAEAFAGARGAYVMVQPNYIPDSPDFPAHQRAIVEAMTAALAEAGTARVVTLSSWGADKPSGTGPVAALHELEERTNGLRAEVTHLRAGYFMENLLGQLENIRRDGVVAAPFRPDLPLPFVATADIGVAAARALDTPGRGAPGSREILEIQGERDLTMHEVTEVIAHAVRRPELRYRHQSIEQFAHQLRVAGVSDSVVGLMVEVVHAVNSGHTRTQQPRSARTSTSTSIESFVRTELVPRLRELDRR